MKTCAVAVDIGYGRVKASSDDKLIEYPSRVADCRQIRYTSNMENRSFMAVEYAGKRFFIGETANRQSTPLVMLDRERFSSDEGMALMVYTLGLLHQNGNDFNVVTGLPVSYYASMKDKYSRTLTGHHYYKSLSPEGEVKENRYLFVKNCKVLPQPMGTLFYYILDKEGTLVNKELASGKIAVIDIGFNTVDLLCTDALEFIDNQSSSFIDIGVSELHKDVKHELEITYELFDLKTQELESSIEKGSIKLRGRSHSIQPQVDKAAEALAQRIVSRALSVWRSLWQYDRIVITGGGSMLLGNYITRALNAPGQVEICAKGTFSNCLGYLRYGKRTWRT